MVTTPKIRLAQFRHINALAKRAIARCEPVISVDTRKKELLGDFKNLAREWRPKGEPELVRVHDFKDKQLGKAIPYGVMTSPQIRDGCQSGSITTLRSSRSTRSAAGWWQHLGQPRYPNATTLHITADCGGSNGNRTRLWKVELQQLANDTGMTIAVCHFPPGTSKWNKIEHRLFSFITMNWRGKPLVSLETIINLIGATTPSSTRPRNTLTRRSCDGSRASEISAGRSSADVFAGSSVGGAARGAPAVAHRDRPRLSDDFQPTRSCRRASPRLICVAMPTYSQP
jgi:Rhodopirellula transposase DDE domain